MKAKVCGLMSLTLIILLSGISFADNKPINRADEIVSIDPDSAMQGDQLWVAISGQDTHFNQGSGTLEVYLSNGANSLYARSYNPVSDTYLEAFFQIPQSFPADLYDLTVTDYDYPFTVTAENIFTITEDPSAVLLSITPIYSKQGDSLWVTITGQNTTFGQGSYTSVCLNQEPANICASSLNIHSSSVLDAYFEIPIDVPEGYYSVAVDADIPPIVTLDSSFYIYSDPGEIISIVPDSAAQGEALWVSITGQNTNLVQGSNTIVFLESTSGRINFYQINIISPTYCEAYFNIPQDASVGLWDVGIDDEFSPFDLILEDGFNVLPDTSTKLLSIDPEYSAQGENLWVTITGLNTHFGQGSITIVRLMHSSSTINAQSMNVISPSVLEAYMEIPVIAPIGYWDVYVNDDYDPQMILSDAFYLYPTPGEIISVDPDSASPGEDLWVTMTGLGTDFTAGSSTIVAYLSRDYANIFSSSITDVTPTSLNARFQIPSWASIGLWDVSVMYNDYLFPATLDNGFNIYEEIAMITSIDPDSAFRGDSLMVAISGIYTNLGQDSTTVWFQQGSSTLYAYSTSVFSLTYLESWFDLPLSVSTGSWDVWVSDWQTMQDVGLSNGFTILYICGDANGDGEFNITDAVWVLNFIFLEGFSPIPLWSGETNCDGDINISDVVWMINYIFLGGHAPCDPDGDGVPDC